jgi:hypothetical protein
MIMLDNDVLSKPCIIPNGIGYLFKYEHEAMDVYIRNISKDRAGNLYAEVDFKGNNRNDFKELLAVKLNLQSFQARHKSALELTKSGIYNEHYDEGCGIPFIELFEDLAQRLIKLHRDGDKPKEIYPSEDVVLTPDYLLEPILYLNHPAVIFGDYGSAKSLVALVIATICQLPYTNNSLNLIAPKDPANCLFIDYEDDQTSFLKRWSALQAGFRTGAVPILYKHMNNTLIDSVEQIQNMVKANHIKLLIVDSLGPAARGNLNDPEPAINYHAALRQIGITSLTLAHCAKESLTTRRTIFGSVFFTNLARSVWECKAEQETGEDETIISLKQTKANLSKLHLPLGYKFTFTDKTIKVSQTELKDTGLSGELPLSFQIKNLLARGPKAVKEIADNLEANQDSVRTAINRLYRKKQLVKVGDSWGLKVIGEN